MWSTPVGPTHIVRWVPPPAVGTALLALTFRDVLCSFVLFPTLTILVVLLVVAWRTPTTWISSVMVTVCCVFAALHWNSTGTCHVRCLRALRSGEPGEHSAPRLQQNIIEQRFTSTLQGTKKPIHLPGCHEAPAQTAGTTAKPADRVFRTCPDTPETRLPFLPQPHQTPRSLHLLRCGGTSWGYSSLWQSDNIILQNYIYRHSTKMLLSVSEELRKKRLKNLSF